MPKYRTRRRNTVSGCGKYIFFIGGSGARVCRAFLHSCAAGAIREDEVRIMLLDADTSNAACMDCEEQYTLYKMQHDMFQDIAQSRKNNIVTPAFHCNVKMYHNKAVSPVEANNRQLKLVVPGYHSNGRRALSWFYDTEEQNQDLLNGFYAHPNIGCIFFQNFSSGDQNPSGPNDLFTPCLKEIVADLQNGDVQIIVIGSLFGGTGAAGIPTVQKVVMEYCKANAPQNLSRLHFGGVFLTPYFKVPPKPQENPSANSNISIDSDTFLSTTQAALYYYQFQDEFDKIYLVGKKEPDLICSKYEDGGADQRNKAHVVELLAVMAAKRFLTYSFDNQDTRSKVEVLSIQPMESSDDTRNQLEWGSDCVSKDFWALADMLRTQVLLETEIYPYVDQKKHKASGMYQWYKAYGMEAYDLSKDDDDLSRMRLFSEDYLEWMYELQYRYMGETDIMDRDPQIALCGDVIADVVDVIRRRTEEEDQRESKFNLEDILSRFNSAVEFAQNMGYVADKAFTLLSALGIVPQPIASLRLAGLFKQLFDLAANRKEMR